MQQLLDVRHVCVKPLHACGDGPSDGRVIGSDRRLPPQNGELIRVPLLLAEQIGQKHQHQRHCLAWDLPVGQVDQFQQLLIRHVRLNHFQPGRLHLIVLLLPELCAELPGQLFHGVPVA